MISDRKDLEYLIEEISLFIGILHTKTFDSSVLQLRRDELDKKLKSQCPYFYQETTKRTRISVLSGILLTMGYTVSNSRFMKEGTQVSGVDIIRLPSPITGKYHFDDFNF